MLPICYAKEGTNVRIHRYHYSFSTHCHLYLSVGSQFSPSCCRTAGIPRKQPSGGSRSRLSPFYSYFKLMHRFRMHWKHLRTFVLIASPISASVNDQGSIHPLSLSTGITMIVLMRFILLLATGCRLQAKAYGFPITLSL